MKKILTVTIAFLLIALVSVAKMVQQQNGKFTKQTEVSFIDFELKKKVMDEKLDDKKMVLYYGKMTWNEQSGWEGIAAEVPVQIFRNLPREKRFIPMAQYFPEADGKFYFMVEKAESDYVLAAFPQRALPENVPKKVLDFFQEMNEDGDDRKGQGNKIH